MGILKRISQMFCRHSVVRVIRYHRNTVPHAWRGRLLYVDRLDVHCFVQCTCCERVLYVDQRENLFEQYDPEGDLAKIKSPPRAALPA